MRKIKLLVFDIDGTLVSHQKNYVEPTALEAIKTAQENGYEVLIATGRPIYFILDEIKEKINPDYYVTINGAALLDKNHNIIKQYPFPLTTTKELIDLAIKYDFPLGFKYHDALRVYNHYEQFIDTYTERFPSFRKDIHFDTNEYYQKELPLGAFMFISDNILKLLQESYPTMKLTHASGLGYDMFEKAVDKTRGIETVLNELGLSWDNVVCFGDGTNDIQMLEKASISVVMGNAIDKVKAYGDYITSSVEEDGIAKALKHLGII